MGNRYRTTQNNAKSLQLIGCKVETRNSKLIKENYYSVIPQRARRQNNWLKHNFKKKGPLTRCGELKVSDSQ